MDDGDFMGISQNQGVKKSASSCGKVGIILRQCRHYRAAMVFVSTLYNWFFRVFSTITILTILTQPAPALSAGRV